MDNPALEPRHNWRVLLQLRAIAIMGQAICVLIIFLFFDTVENTALMAAIIAVYALINGILWVQLRNPELPGNKSYLFQILLDIAELSAIFYLSGGTDNPFIFYFLVPLSISAVVLPLSHVVCVAVSAIIAFSFLSVYNLPLPEFTEKSLNLTLSHFALWFNFAMCCIFITGFITHIVGYMRKQQSWLSDSREHLLQDEQILAIATHAAGTAHELGTPLNSMKLIIEELLLDIKDNETAHKDVQQLKTQLDNCTQILRNLSEEARINEHWHNDITDATQYMEKVLDKWRILRPDVSLNYQVKAGASPFIKVDPTLDQAFLNLLNNAADANPNAIEIKAKWNLEEFILTIKDHGAGISNQVLERLGQKLTTTKDGMGIGFFLSNASVARRGGTVALYPVEEGGTLTRITIPFAEKQT
ncbi:sensor histidine kinase [Marinomonas sp. MED121]|uniref:ATP-binding protein n=1 Tax=Marinomonas sp. MED121 TaxID=314277 RepID=UPI0000690DA2|nr:ATP-binding protein [Marinomonas sp. MED121]EAQ65184.1 sensor histidine kinase [Marinomonas sp. MED121]